MHNHDEGIRETMKNIFILILCFFCLGCASIVNSELELVSIKGLSSEGTHFFFSPNGRTEIVGSNVVEGEGKVFLPRSRTDYNATVICPDCKKIATPIEPSFDMGKGIYLPIIYKVASSGWVIVQALTSSLIDYYYDSAYSVVEIVLPVSCVDLK